MDIRVEFTVKSEKLNAAIKKVSDTIGCTILYKNAVFHGKTVSLYLDVKFDSAEARQRGHALFVRSALNGLVNECNQFRKIIRKKLK